MKSEKGYNLMEVIVAMALMGIVAVALLGGLSTAYSLTSVADERATGESLARTQMEYARNQPYSSAPWNYTVTSTGRSSTDSPSWYVTGSNPPLLSSDYVGYTVNVQALLLHAADDGLQRIDVTVSYPGRSDIILENYRSAR